MIAEIKEECPACQVRTAMIRAVVESIEPQMADPQKPIIHDNRPPNIAFRCRDCLADHFFPHPDKQPREVWPSQSREYEYQPRGWIQANKRCDCGGKLAIVD